MESIDLRKSALKNWLEQDCALPSIKMQAMPGDASTRRYFRIQQHDYSLVAMDAPNAHDNCAAFIAIGNALREIGIKTPEILAADITKGFLLLSDFGNLTFLKALHKNNVHLLYDHALSALSLLQQCRQVTGHVVPEFNRQFMNQEWLWHKEWFLNKFLGITLGDEETELDYCMALLVESAAIQPQVFMHRDYHSANLMVLEQGGVGVLDFQDAFIGPITYDLVSLLRDCYIAWPQHEVKTWVLQYWQRLKAAGLNIDQQDFLRWFDWMGIQRHLKALLTFARKKVRDQQAAYLQHMPRTMAYLLHATFRYPELIVLHRFLDEQVQPVLQREKICEA